MALDQRSLVFGAERALHGEYLRQHVAVELRLWHRAPLSNLLWPIPLARCAVFGGLRRAGNASKVSRLPCPWGADIRPSLRLLLAEYQKYSLDRGWFYYPDALPVNAIAEKSRNGQIERSLSVPLEDMQDGRKPSGEVGQELYGSGLAFVYTTRHYTVLASANCSVHCNYPIFGFVEESRGNVRVVRFRIGGDTRGDCELRIIPIDAEKPVPNYSVKPARASAHLNPTMTVEGHTAYRVRGDTSYEIRLTRTKKPATVAS